MNSVTFVGEISLPIVEVDVLLESPEAFDRFLHILDKLDKISKGASARLNLTVIFQEDRGRFTNEVDKEVKRAVHRLLASFSRA